MIRRTAILCVLTAAALAWAASATAQIVVRPPKVGRPEVWKNASDADTKAAEEAARVDACYRLVEAAYRHRRARREAKEPQRDSSDAYAAN